MNTLSVSIVRSHAVPYKAGLVLLSPVVVGGVVSAIPVRFILRKQRQLACIHLENGSTPKNCGGASPQFHNNIFIPEGARNFPRHFSSSAWIARRFIHC